MLCKLAARCIISYKFKYVLSFLLLPFFIQVGWSSGIFNPGSGSGGSSSLPLPQGATNYIQNTNSLQDGATFYVSSGTVVNFTATDSTFTNITASQITFPNQGNTRIIFVNGSNLGSSSTFIWNGTTMTAPAVLVNGQVGESVTFGLTAGTATVRNLSASQYVKSDANKMLVSQSGVPATDLTGTVDISAQTNLTASGNATLSNDNVGVGPIKIGSGTIGPFDVSNTSASVTGAAGLAVTYNVNAGSTTGSGLSTCGDSTHGLSWTAGQFGCQSITGSGGGGSFSMAVGTGTITTYANPTTSTSSVNTNLIFNKTQFKSALVDGNTVFIQVDPSTFTMLGQLTTSGQATIVGSNIGVGPTSFSTGTIGTVDISAQTNLAVAGQAVLSNDTVGVGPVKIGSGTIGAFDVTLASASVTGTSGLSVPWPIVMGTATFNNGVSYSTATSIKTSNYTMTGADHIIFASSTATSTNFITTVTLPSASAVPTGGQEVSIWKIDQSTIPVAIVPQGVDTIAGISTITLVTYGINQMFISDGNKTWYPVGKLHHPPAYMGNYTDIAGAAALVASTTYHQPWELQEPCDVKSASFHETGATSGRMVIGIYDQFGNLVVSSGPFVTPAAGDDTINLQKTNLQPGLYYIAMGVNQASAPTFTRYQSNQVGGSYSKAAGASFPTSGLIASIGNPPSFDAKGTSNLAPAMTINCWNGAP